LAIFAAIRRASSWVNLIPGRRALLTAKPEYPPILQMTGFIQKQKMLRIVVIVRNTTLYSRAKMACV
jgi:hypothetical protein